MHMHTRYLVCISRNSHRATASHREIGPKNAHRIYPSTPRTTKKITLPTQAHDLVGAMMIALIDICWYPQAGVSAP